MDTQTAAAQSQPGTTAPSRRDTFLRLIRQYEPALKRLAGAYVVRAEDRQDLFQEISLALWQAVPGFRGHANERTWLYRIAHNVAISASAKLRKRGQKEVELIGPVERSSGSTGPDEKLMRDERQQLLLTLIRALPGVDRQLLLLHLEDLSYAEMEEVSGLAQGAIATRLSRIREKLTEKVSAVGIRK